MKLNTRELNRSSHSSSEEKKPAPENKNSGQRAPMQDIVISKRNKFKIEKSIRSNNVRSFNINANALPKPMRTRNDGKAQIPPYEEFNIPISTPDSENTVNLDPENHAAENDHSAESSSTHEANEKTSLLKNEDSLTTPRNTKLPRLSRLPRFGAVIVSPRRNKTKSETAKMPTLSRNKKPHYPHVQDDLISIHHDPLFSPYDIAKAKKGNVRAAIALPNPDGPSGLLSPDNLADVLTNLFTNPNEQEVKLRVMNILYCAAGGSSAIESASFPEVGAYAAFLSNGQADSDQTASYLRTLFDALQPLLGNKAKNELLIAYGSSDRMSALRRCLGLHIAPAIPLAISNLPMVFDLTKDVPGESLSRRTLNLILCATGGKDAINHSAFPETGPYAKSLTKLHDENRPRVVQELIATLGDHLDDYDRSLLLKFGANFKGIRSYCESRLYTIE